MEGKEIILKKHLSELFGRDIEPNDGIIIDIKTAKKAMDDYASTIHSELEKARELIKEYMADTRKVYEKMDTFLNEGKK